MAEPGTLDQREFDLTIGRLDRLLSVLIKYATDGHLHNSMLPPDLDGANIQTLKHHAEDMIGAGHKILKVLGFEKPNDLLSHQGRS